MRISPVIIVPTLALGALACSDEARENSPVSDDRPAAAQEDPTAVSPERNPKRSAEPEPAGHGISSVSGGAATTLEGGPAKRGVVKLSWVEPSAVKGSLYLDGATYRVNGYERQGTLSCWLTSSSDDPDQTRRGVLRGTAKGKAYQGIFVISGNGGTAPLNGTWSAE